MASKRKVTQDDLRKLMANMKSNPSASNKKLKLSSKELALIEEEKRQKSIRDQEKIRLKQEKMARIVPNQSLQPKKSILKSSSVSTYKYNPPQYQLKSHDTSSQSETKTKSVQIESEDTQSTSNSSKVPKVTEETVPDEEAGALPEGFFDDPKLDAKARNVQYVSEHI